MTHIGTAIDKERPQISERMTWLVVSGSFMFSAFMPGAINQPTRSAPAPE